MSFIEMEGIIINREWFEKNMRYVRVLKEDQKYVVRARMDIGIDVDLVTALNKEVAEEFLRDLAGMLNRPPALPKDLVDEGLDALGELAKAAALVDGDEDPFDLIKKVRDKLAKIE